MEHHAIAVAALAILVAESHAAPPPEGLLLDQQSLESILPESQSVLRLFDDAEVVILVTEALQASVAGQFAFTQCSIYPLPAERFLASPAAFALRGDGDVFAVGEGVWGTASMSSAVASDGSTGSIGRGIDFVFTLAPE